MAINVLNKIKRLTYLAFNKNSLLTSLTPPSPATIYIIINNICNLRCKMCDVGQKNKESQFYQLMCPEGDRQLDMTILKKFIDDVKVFKPTIAVTSTEPLLFGQVFEFVRAVKQAGMSFQLTTNGLLLPRYAEEVVKSGVDSLWISLDGPLEVHNEIRGHPKSFQNAVEGLKLVHLLAKKYTKKISLHVNFSYSNHNCGVLTAFLESLKGLPINSVCVSHMNYVTSGMAGTHNENYSHFCQATPSSIAMADPTQVDADIMWEEIKEAKKCRWPFTIGFAPDLDQEGIRNFYYHPEVIVRSKKCPAPWTTGQLAANGDWVITTRCFLKVMGNIYEESFMETWHGENYQEFRRWILENEMSPACTRCCAVF